jgi:hypothetical protein
MKIHSLFILLLVVLAGCSVSRTDVLVVGGSASGVTAGLQASRMGAKTIITEETPWLGGMLTAAGVSAIDGNYRLPSGLFGEFRDSLEARYGGADALKTGWVSNILFEPATGNAILQNMTKRENKLDVWQNTQFISVGKTLTGKWLVCFKKDSQKHKILSRVLIDATELGDVAAACGVKYDVGMEARDVCNESIAPAQANDIIQDLTYVMILKDYGKDVTIRKPDGYDPSLFYCTASGPDCTQPKAGQTLWKPEQMITYGKLPGNKYMINWPIEGNDFYVNMIEMNASDRLKAVQKAKNFSLCYLYYLQTKLGFSHLGLDNEQFPTDDNFPFIPYHRESRRIHGMVRFNVNHITKPFDQAEALYRTGVAVGDYPVDHHHKRYPEYEQLPELHFYPIPSYNVPLGVLIPKNKDGLIVAEKSISVSNLVNGTTRLQPVVMQLGQAAGVLSVLALKKHGSIKKVSVRNVQTELLEHGGYIMPYLDLPKTDPYFKAVQRIGATGILKGKGMNVGWKNETWFMTDSLVNTSELSQGLKEYDSKFGYRFSADKLTTEDFLNLINYLRKLYDKPVISQSEFSRDISLIGFELSDNNSFITRKEFSALLDFYIHPFELKEIDLAGKYK